MEIKINIENKDGSSSDIKLDSIKFQKMVLLFNAINDGWSIKKQNDSYIFKKNHEGKKEIFQDEYLLTFMKGNFDINRLIS
jgi:hypothetical protein|uniref:Uncharacterized protein n=1 Tax=viral metagenome TaxID=1070528 RepID=A0A6C0HCM4_9ZZZZ